MFKRISLFTWFFFLLVAWGLVIAVNARGQTFDESSTADPAYAPLRSAYEPLGPGDKLISIADLDSIFVKRVRVGFAGGSDPSDSLWIIYQTAGNATDSLFFLDDVGGGNGGGGGGGDITGVAAGTGLTGGGSSGNVTLSVTNPFTEADETKLDGLANITSIGDRLTLSGGVLSADVQGGSGGMADGVISGVTFAGDLSTMTITRTIGSALTINIPEGLRYSLASGAFSDATTTDTPASGTFAGRMLPSNTDDKAWSARRIGQIVHFLLNTRYSTADETKLNNLPAITSIGSRLTLSAGGVLSADVQSGTGGGVDLSDYYTKEQVDTRRDNALDGLVGEQHVNIPVLTTGRNYDGARTQESTTATILTTGSLLTTSDYTLTSATRSLAAGGAALTLQLQASHGLTSTTGFDPRVELEIILANDDESQFGEIQRFDLPAGSSFAPFTFTLPANWLATGDPSGEDQDLYITIRARVTIRGLRSVGIVRLNRATIDIVGSHETEFETLANRLIGIVTDPLGSRLDREDSSLQSQITQVLPNLVTDQMRRILGLFDLVQETNYVSYSADIRDGTSGAFTEDISGLTPNSAFVEVRIPITDAVAKLDNLFLRQDNAQGVAKDTPFNGHGHASDHTTFTYRFLVRSGTPIDLVERTTADNLTIIEEVDHLSDYVDELDGVLTPDSRAFLTELKTETLSTQPVTRTSLLPSLTAARQTISGSAAPFTSGSLGGGEHVVAMHHETTSQLTTATTLVEAFLNNNDRLPLIEAEYDGRLANRLYAPILIPEQQARTANATVYLHDANVPSPQNEYRYVLHDVRRDGTRPTELEALFLVPSTVPANTQATITLRAFENDVEVPGDSQNISVEIGGSQSGSETSTSFLRNWNARTQYQILGGVRYVTIIFAPQQTNVVANYYTLASVSYTASMQIPAVAEHIGRQQIYQGGSFTAPGGLIGFKIEDGLLVLILEDAPGSGWLEGELNTRIPASRYGLQSGGTGVLRFFNNGYRELIQITAGDLDAAALGTLRTQLTNESFGLGLFSNSSATNMVFETDRAFRAPALYIGTQQVVPGGGGGGGQPDGVISGLSFSTNLQTLTATRSIGGAITASVPDGLRYSLPTGAFSDATTTDVPSGGDFAGRTLPTDNLPRAWSARRIGQITHMLLATRYSDANETKLGNLPAITAIGDRLTLASDGTLSADVQMGGGGGEGTITGVTAGTGLSGGGSSGNVTLSVTNPFTDADEAKLDGLANITSVGDRLTLSNGVLSADVQSGGGGPPAVPARTEFVNFADKDDINAAGESLTTAATNTSGVIFPAGETTTSLVTVPASSETFTVHNAGTYMVDIYGNITTGTFRNPSGRVDIFGYILDPQDNEVGRLTLVYQRNTPASGDGLRCYFIGKLTVTAANTVVDVHLETNTTGGGSMVSDVDLTDARMTLTPVLVGERGPAGPPGTGGGGAGTITGITAGAGLSGGGTTGNVTLSVTNPFTAADESKLDGIAAGATANVGDITGVAAGTGLSGGGNSGNVTLSVTNPFEAADETKLDGLANITSVGARLTLSNGVLSADMQSGGGGGVAGVSSISAGAGLSGTATTGDVTLSVTNPFTDADESKLDGIAAGATANVGTITGITTDATLNGGGTSGNISLSVANPFTDADESKLDGIAAGATANVGDITAVAAGTGLSGGGNSGAVTLSVTNPFTASEKTKLAGVATGATANVGDITGVAAGTGLTGGGNSGNVTLAVANPFENADETKLDALATNRQLPAGGTNGQVLAKTADADYSVGWLTPPMGGSDASELARTERLLFQDETNVNATARQLTLLATGFENVLFPSGETATQLFTAVGGQNTFTVLAAGTYIIDLSGMVTTGAVRNNTGRLDLGGFLQDASNNVIGRLQLTYQRQVAADAGTAVYLVGRLTATAANTVASVHLQTSPTGTGGPGVSEVDIDNATLALTPVISGPAGPQGPQGEKGDPGQDGTVSESRVSTIADQRAAARFTTAEKNKLAGVATGATANQGDITGVFAGAGLTGGSSVGNATLSVTNPFTDQDEAKLDGLDANKLNALATNRQMPAGGADGQVLTKTAATDYAVAWEDAAAPATGPTLIGESNINITTSNIFNDAGFDWPATIGDDDFFVVELGLSQSGRSWGGSLIITGKALNGVTRGSVRDNPTSGAEDQSKFIAYPRAAFRASGAAAVDFVVFFGRASDNSVLVGVNATTFDHMPLRITQLGGGGGGGGGGQPNGNQNNGGVGKMLVGQSNATFTSVNTFVDSGIDWPSTINDDDLFFVSLGQRNSTSTRTGTHVVMGVDVKGLTRGVVGDNARREATDQSKFILLSFGQIVDDTGNRISETLYIGRAADNSILIASSQITQHAMPIRIVRL